MPDAPGRVITREQWGARPFPRAHVPVTSDATAGTEGHHSVTPAQWAAEVHARRIEADHLGRGWNGPYYAWGAHASGDVIELRGWHRSQGEQQFRRAEGYYAPIVFLMDERTDQLTEGHQAAWRFLRSVILLGNPDAHLIGWHNGRPNPDHARTYCPGPKVSGWLQSSEAHTPWAWDTQYRRDPNMAHWSDKYLDDLPVTDPPIWTGTDPDKPATKAEVAVMLHRYGQHLQAQLDAAGHAPEAIRAEVDRQLGTKVADAVKAATSDARLRRLLKGLQVKLNLNGTVQ